METPKKRSKFKIGCLGSIGIVIIFFIICAFGSTQTAKSINNAANQVSTTSQKITNDINSHSNNEPTTKPVPKPQPIEKTQPVVQQHPVQEKQPVVQHQSNQQQNNTADENIFNSNGVVKTLGTGYDHAKLHSGPSSSSSGYDLTPGTQVQILGESNEYYHVELSNGTTGYIYAPFVARN